MRKIIWLSALPTPPTAIECATEGFLLFIIGALFVMGFGSL